MKLRMQNSGERRLPACSIRPLAEYTWQRKHPKRRGIFAASCRELQAGGLCSPEFTIRWNDIPA